MRRVRRAGAGSADRAVVLIVVGALVAYGAGWGWNGLLNLVVVRAHPASPARATAITSVGGRVAGAVGPFTFGLVATHASYADAWLMNGTAALLGAGMLLVGRHLLRARGPAVSP